MFPILITRPEPSATQTAKLFQKAGFDTLIEPLLEITPATHLFNDLKKYQAIVTTSAAAIRTLAGLSDVRDIRLWCVGESSNKTAKELGYKQIYHPEENENAHSLFAMIKNSLNPQDGPIFYAAGDIVKVDLKKLLLEAKFEVDQEAIYHSKMKNNFSSKAKAFLKHQQQGAITFYSERTVKVFLDLCRKESIPFDFNRFIALSLSNAIAAKVEKLPWLQVITASTTAQLIVNLKELLNEN